MFDGLTINAAIETCFDNAQRCIDDMEPLAHKVADARRDYRLAYAKKQIQYRDSGTAVSMLDKAVKGSQEVSRLEYLLTLSEAEYDANHEACLLWKKRADYYRELASREWSRAGESND